MKLNLVLALLVAVSVLTGCARQQPAAPPPLDVIAPAGAPSVRITAHPERPGRAIPADFLGLGYDASTLAAGYFDVGNEQLINLLGNLGNGVLVYCAQGVEYTYFAHNFPEKLLIVIRNLGSRAVLLPPDFNRMFAFARKTGWKVILGLNLRVNNPQMAADEAAYASQVGGNSLLAFEIGNEPDLYARDGLRPPEYTYADYRREFETYVRAIRNRMPGAPIAGPVSASKFEWFDSFLKDKAKDIVLATNHYYPLNAKPGVDPADPTYATVENLLGPVTKKRAVDLARRFVSAAGAAGVPLRFDETNSSYPAKEGLGDVFGAALWSADYLFDLLENGVVGANFFGYFTCRGYTPICRQTFLWQSSYRARPLYYGLLLFSFAAQGKVVPVEVNTSLNITAHATLGSDGKMRVVVINKDGTRTVNAEISAGSSYTKAGSYRLIGGSLEAREGITFAGNPVAEDGTWRPGVPGQVKLVGSVYQLGVPPASAVVVTFE